MSNDSKELIPYMYCNGSFVTQSVYLSNNTLQFDCLNKCLDILPEAVN